MLYSTFEIGSAFASLACMLITIFCIVFGAKESRTPTFVSVAGCAFYFVFLMLAKNNMDMAQQQTYSSLILAFVPFVLTAEGIYRTAKKQRKAAFSAKFAEFKERCSDARNASCISEAA